MVDSGSRVTSLARTLRAQGAARIFAYAPHGLLTGNATKLIENSPLEELVTLNTVQQATLLDRQVRFCENE